MGESASGLSKRHCKPCEGGTTPLVKEAIENNLIDLPGWQHVDNSIMKHFEFKNFYQTMAFVNAVAWIAHIEGHHPDLEVAYKFCRVRFTTHGIAGLSENDFICAAKVEDLIPG